MKSKMEENFSKTSDLGTNFSKTSDLGTNFSKTSDLGTNFSKTDSEEAGSKSSDAPKTKENPLQNLADKSEDISSREDLGLENLNKAWTCVLSQYRDLAKENSIKEGKGLNIFKMASKKEQKDNSNCQYFFANSAMWDLFLDSSPKKEDFLETFNPNNMYCVMVSVPLPGIEVDTIQTIRIFKIENDEEIYF
jgi:hypothetical protein